LLKPLQKRNRHDEIRKKLLNHILDNKLQPGDRLPSENDISNQLQVSRNSVREALKALEAQGIIEVRPGLGTYVKEFDFDDILTSFVFNFLFTGRSVVELYAIRKKLELGFIKEAVRSVTDRDVRELRSILRKMKDKADRGISFADEDMELHRAIFRSTDNVSLLQLLNIFGALYKGAPFLSNYTPNEIQQDYQRHAALVEAIAARDEDDAFIRLDQHFVKLKKAGLLSKE
jgi:DNA-binding FadR family transcriptional regulator